MRRLLAVTVLLAAAPALADEGMWTFDNFPSKKVQEAYGFSPDQAWLDHVRLSSARLAGGCSASFVSPQGLVLTNHHCARGCIANLSTAERDFMKDGYFARSFEEEKMCPGVEINKLVKIEDVTERVNKATANLSGEQFVAAQKAVFSELEQACATSDEVRCDMVTLYQGGQYHLYQYERFQDVRMVFAPETAIAFFGGDPDNFEFPRYTLDMTFLRVYKDGKPAKIDHYFKWSEKGAQPDELTFISGNPGTTNRLNTIAQLVYARDVQLPNRLMGLAELKGALTQYAKGGPEQARTAQGLIFGLENSLKALRGRREALVDPRFFAQLVEQENTLRKRVNANSRMRREYGSAWDEIEKAVKRSQELRVPATYLLGGPYSQLLGYGRALVNAAHELQKPNNEREAAYTEARLPSLKARLAAPVPVYPEVDEITIAVWLSNFRADLGPDHPAVKALLGNDSPETLARKITQGSKLADPAARQQLFEGGLQAIEASGDPAIVFARKLRPFSEELRQTVEKELAATFDKNQERIAKARFEVYGTSIYPDATFSPRLSYGKVTGWVENGEQIDPITVMSGTFERATGEDPFALPQSWLLRKDAIKGDTPFNFVTTNDIIGGNSGSPMFNKDAEITGLVFDGNIHSLGGEYGFDPALNRSVGVHTAGMTEAMRSIYGTTRLLEELGLSPR
ncbi:MAG TPA: S46 family peptidase [Myxococcaceae bacterium]|nr:S46 family peptidase [Myxococcaceae bacterium]